MIWIMQDSYSIEGKNLTADMVEAIHYEGKSVYGWTANTSGCHAADRE